MVALAAFVALQILPPRGRVQGENPWRPQPGGPPLLIAHGGGQGLRPPNTMEAFENSVSLGCDVLEMDLRLTRDGALVTLHDETIDRTSDGTGRAIDFTVSELKTRNFGFKFRDPEGKQPFRDTPARIAVLEELFQRFPTIPMVLELKDRGTTGAIAASALRALIDRHHRAKTVIIASFDDQTLAEFRRLTGGGVFTACGMATTRSFVMMNLARLDWFAPVGYQALQIPTTKLGYQLDTPRLIRSAHDRNMAVHYWTINDPEEMRRLIRLGADGLMTDRPDLMRKVLSGLK